MSRELMFCLIKLVMQMITHLFLLIANQPSSATTPKMLVGTSNVVTESRLSNLVNGAKNGNHLSCHLSQVVIPSIAERCGVEICKCSSNNYMNVYL